MSARTTTMARPVAIARLVFTLVVAVLVGTMLVPVVDAAKIKVGSSVQNRVQSQRDLCEIVGGGTLTVVKVGKATVTDCNGGSSDGYRCVFTKGTPSACHQAYTPPPPPPNDEVAPPPSGVASPTGGGSTSGGDSTTDGGTGGSGLTPPGTATDNPSVSDGGGGVVHIASRGGEHDHAQHHGKHHRQRHSKGRTG